MEKSKGSLLGVLLYFLLVIVLLGLIRRTWKALLVCLILGFVLVIIFPNIFLADIIPSDTFYSTPLSEEELNSIRAEQMFMTAGMCYFMYLAFLLLTGRLLTTLLNDKFSSALRDAEKVAEEDPGMEARIQQFSKDSEKLKVDMEEFCKRFPDSPLCDKGRSRGGFYEAEY